MVQQNPRVAKLASISQKSWILLTAFFLIWYNAITSLSSGIDLTLRSDRARRVNSFFDFPLIDVQASITKPLTFLPNFFVGVAKISIGTFCIFLGVRLLKPLRNSLENDQSLFEESSRKLEQQKEFEAKTKREAEQERLRRLAERKKIPKADTDKPRETPEARPRQVPKEHLPKPTQDIHLGRLQIDFSRRAIELKDRDRLLGDLSSDIFSVANQVWLLATNWLAFFDGDDFELCNDRETYNLIARVAQQGNLSIEQVAQFNMENIAMSLYDFEISLALLSCADVIGSELKLNENVDETFEHLVNFRDQSIDHKFKLLTPTGPTKKQFHNGIADTRSLWSFESGAQDSYPWWTSPSR